MNSDRGQSLPFFSSARERNLWLWALVVLVAIASTLGPVQSLVQELRSQNLLRLTMGLILVTGLLVFGWRWVKTRPGRAEIAVFLAVALVYAWAWARVETPEERTHLFEYGILTVLFHRALIERHAQGRLKRSPALVATVMAAGLGILDETIQWVLPNRVFDWRDVGFNLFAVLVAMGTRLAVAWIKRRRH